MANNNFLIETNQRWKLNIFATGLVILGITRLILIFFLKDRPYWVDPIYMSMLLLTFFSFLYFVRCPKCHAKVALQILRTVPFQKTYEEITKFEKCPCCNYFPNLE